VNRAAPAAVILQEGIQFETGINVGVDVMLRDRGNFDALLLCTGATIPRHLPIPGRDLSGAHFAMDFLTRQNRWSAGDDPAAIVLPPISAEGKRVVVIGGGDTGSNCIGTSIRQNAKSLTNFELFTRLHRRSTG
jgi:glutamate synthase (NADPH/NADH) small chain